MSKSKPQPMPPITCTVCGRDPTPGTGRYGRYGNRSMVCRYCKTRTRNLLDKKVPTEEIEASVRAAAPRAPRDVIACHRCGGEVPGQPREKGIEYTCEKCKTFHWKETQGRAGGTVFGPDTPRWQPPGEKVGLVAKPMGQTAIGIFHTVLEGHVLDKLCEIPDESVDVVISSPPYWGLRQYPVPAVKMGGDPACEHDWQFVPAINRTSPGDLPSPGSAASHRDNEKVNRPVVPSHVCGKCGAWRGQYGQEPTVSMYTEHTMMIMAECWRVLKPSGSVWWVICDSYARSGGAGGNWTEGRRASAPKWRAPRDPAVVAGLVAMPERFVVAMTDAGWQRPNTILWHKDSVFPYSGGTRFTIDFEYIYWFVKDYDQYYFMQQKQRSKTRTKPAGNKSSYGGVKKAKGATKEAYTNGTYRGAGSYCNPDRKRNMRTTWTIQTSKCKEVEHYATFPGEIPERIISATCPKGGVVLDPFAGTGTVLAVAKRMGRSAIGIELSPEFAAFARKRIENTSVKHLKNETVQKSLAAFIMG